MNNKTHSLRPAFAEMAEDEQQKAPVSTLRPFHFLVDYENVQPADLGSFAGTDDRVIVFLGFHQTKLPCDLVMATQPLGGARTLCEDSQRWQKRARFPSCVLSWGVGGDNSPRAIPNRLERHRLRSACRPSLRQGFSR